MCVATHLDRNFSSSIVRAMAYKGRCISETELAIGLKFGARLVLLIYTRDRNLSEKSHMTGFVVDGHNYVLCLGGIRAPAPSHHH